MGLNHHTTFLDRVARQYMMHERDCLADYCFIFPNKRSGMFFRKALLDLAGDDAPFFEPQVTTIGEFVADLSDYVEAGRYDLLFTLYNVYSSLSADVDDFDRFVFWGDMLISDFNDVDRYMVDARRLFGNVRDLREISTDYLTDEQKEIIARYWGDVVMPSSDDRFWKHLNGAGGCRDMRDRFLRLWELLYDIYEGYRKNLAEAGLCYSGMQYREVAGKLASMTADELPYKRVIAIGFNLLSISELRIFECLQRLDAADFYWDDTLPDEISEGTTATRFISRNAKAYPSRYDISRPDGDCVLPSIDIVSVPSNVGQVKYVGQLLDSMVADGTIANAVDAIDTAVVLPSEDLFIEMLHSMPAAIGAVNITMGYPMRLTPVAALMRSIVSLHLRARKVRDRWCFFYEDINTVLSHSLMRAIAPGECEKIKARLEKSRMFSVDASLLAAEYPVVAPVFFPVEDLHSAADVFGYTINLVNFISERLKAVRTDDNPLELELGFLTCYRQAVQHLWHTMQRHGMNMRHTTFFHLIERTVAAESVNFVGEPLCGLQIMGVLETRALDFDNVIMLSMNERVFPRKHYSRSFIPNSIRRSYGMSTMEHQESLYAYYFYRLISSARHVTLLYDARNSGIKSGEMSRYLYQLQYLWPADKLRVTTAYYDVPPVELPHQLEVAKTPEVMDKLSCYLHGSKSPRNLSASAINEYINCPLSFYLKRIEGIYVDDEMVEYMDEGTFGTVVHRVAETAYKGLRRDGSREVPVTAEVLDRLIADRPYVDRLVTSAINEYFNKLASQAPYGSEYVNTTPLVGEAAVIGEVVVHFMHRLFEEEKKFTPFIFVEGEDSFKVPYKVNDNLTVNITATIDRVDRVLDPSGDRLRIVDYKTGSDKLVLKGVEDMFVDPDSRSRRCKAVLQLFVYCNAYRMHYGYDGAIQPVLYLLRTMSVEGLNPVKIGGEALDDYRRYNEEVSAMLAEKLGELFDAEVPFRAAESDTHCHYCKFKHVCARE